MNETANTDSSTPRSADFAERASRVIYPLFSVVPAAMLAIGAWRQRWMDDDGFINLRVVRNILHGHGPVFNLGERIEVCTSPLWTAILTAAGALGVPLEAAAVTLGIALTVLASVLASRAALRFQRKAGDDVDSVAWPIGIGVFAVIPAAWDYASSGLETGLSLAWLAGCYLALAHLLTRPELRPRAPATIAAAALFGLGPLIRPELALYSAAWFVPLLVRLVRDGADAPGHKRRVATSVLVLALSALALPLAYELFRMGYYGTVTPNTAIAKEAFRSNWQQGLYYFRNFFVVYAMGGPAVAVAVFLDARLRALHGASDRVGAIAVAAPVVAGLAQIVYIMAIGGDYMHGRMFLPPVFAILLPVAAVRFREESRRNEIILAGTGAMLLVWMGFCSLRLRPSQENEHDIGDERGWYVRESDVAAPVTLGRYRKHSFYKSAETDLTKIEADCASIDHDDPKEGDACRTLYLSDNDRSKDIGKLVPERATYPLAPDVDRRVGLATATGAIGIFGYLLPDAVHVIDRHGLAEPLASHLELAASRGRPGHEKMLSDAWLIGRYAAPLSPEDARVTAARHALGCGDLRALLDSSTAPLTSDRFFANMAHAFAFTKLRLPKDPFEAEARFCGTPPLETEAAGGTGGDPFRWQCPAGSRLMALRGEVSDADKALARVEAVCGASGANAMGGETGESGDGPWLGRKKNEENDKKPVSPFEVSCTGSDGATGLFGIKSSLVQGVGLVCGSAETQDGATFRSAAAGETTGTSFMLGCKAGTYAVGILGRAGDLIDRLGVVCAP